MASLHFRTLAIILMFGALACSAVTATNVVLQNLVVDATPTNKANQTAVLAGGCFWGVEGVFEHVKGVTGVTSGYSGGAANTANYERVSSGETGHAESVRITYDSSQIS